MSYGRLISRNTFKENVVSQQITKHRMAQTKLNVHDHCKQYVKEFGFQCRPRSALGTNQTTEYLVYKFIGYSAPDSLAALNTLHTLITAL